MLDSKTVIVFGVGVLLGLLIGVILLIKEFRKRKQRSLDIQRSITKGTVSENIAPLFPDFPGEISETRFIGKPVDYLVFKGMDQENITEVVFVEVKTGKSPKLSDNERSLKETIQSKKVSWKLYEPPNRF